MGVSDNDTVLKNIVTWDMGNSKNCHMRKQATKKSDIGIS